MKFLFVHTPPGYIYFQLFPECRGNIIIAYFNLLRFSPCPPKGARVIYYRSDNIILIIYKTTSILFIYTLVHLLTQVYLSRAPFGGQGADSGRLKQIILLLFQKIPEDKKTACWQ